MKPVPEDRVVRLLGPEDDATCDALVGAADPAAVAHTLAWRRVLVDRGMGEPVAWGAFEGDRLVGALPAFVRRARSGAVLNSMPFVQGTGGPVGRAREALLDAMLEWSASNVRVAVVVGSAFTSDADASRAPDFVRHRPVLALDLRAPLAYRSSVVGSIRKAAEHQPVHRLATDLAGVRLVWEVYAEGARRNGLTPHPLALFESIHAHLGAQARFAWAEVGGAAAAAVVLLQTATTVDYYVAGTTERGRETQAGSWLADVEIRAAVARGGRIWNWMASPNQAVADYKKRWGAEEHTYSVRGWTFGDLGDWRGAAPGVLAAEFPGYFVVPYASPVVI